MYEDDVLLSTSTDVVATAETMGMAEAEVTMAPATNYDDGQEDYGYEASEADSDIVEDSDDSPRSASEHMTDA